MTAKQLFVGDPSLTHWTRLTANSKVTLDNGDVVHGVKEANPAWRVYELFKGAPPAPAYDARWQTLNAKYSVYEHAPNSVTVSWRVDTKEVSDVYPVRVEELKNVLRQKGDSSSAGISREVLPMLALLGDDPRTAWLPAPGTADSIEGTPATRGAILSAARNAAFALFDAYKGHWDALKLAYDNNDIKSLATYDLNKGWPA